MRFVPEIPDLEIMAATSSKSYAKSYIYAVTVSGRLYSVRVGTDVNSKTIVELDPRTGKRLNDCSFHTADTYGGFAIIGDKVYYVDKVKTDIYGEVTGGGELKMNQFPCRQAATTLLDNWALANAGELMAVGNHLLRVVWLEDDKYEIREINKLTGEIDRVLTTLTNKYRTFFAGTDALYWYDKSEPAGVNFIRYPLAGAAEVIFTLPWAANDLYNVGVDEEDGTIFMVFGISFDPAERYFYLFDLSNNSLADLPIDPSLFSTSIQGNGQFLFID